MKGHFRYLIIVSCVTAGYKMTSYPNAYAADISKLESSSSSSGSSAIALNLRKFDIFQTAARVFLDYKVLSWRCDQMEDTPEASRAKDELWERAHERNAQFLYDKFTSLEALWIKLGQYLSSRADIMPEPYLKILSKCQDSLPHRYLRFYDSLQLVIV